MNLKIESQENGSCHLALSGRISQTTVGSQADPMSQVLGEAHFSQNVLMSLRDTDYIDSSGIGWILATDKKIRDQGGKLILHSVPLDVQHVFGLMKLQKVLNIRKNLEEAKADTVEQQHGD